MHLSQSTRNNETGHIAHIGVTSEVRARKRSHFYVVRVRDLTDNGIVRSRIYDTLMQINRVGMAVCAC